MTDSAKYAAAEGALAWVKPDAVIGIGSGSTVACFIECLKNVRKDIEATVASSALTERLLREAGLPVVPLSSVSQLSLYVDGADAIDRRGHCLKGGGAALTQEKIVADAADTFVCIVGDDKVHPTLPETVPLTIEVIEMARSWVARRCVALGGQPVYREGCVTDQGHQIIDVFGLDMTHLSDLDHAINQWPGVVCHGLFVTQKAHHMVVGHANGKWDTHTFD